MRTVVAAPLKMALSWVVVTESQTAGLLHLGSLPASRLVPYTASSLEWLMRPSQRWVTTRS